MGINGVGSSVIAFGAGKTGTAGKAAKAVNVKSSEETAAKGAEQAGFFKSIGNAVKSISDSICKGAKKVGAGISDVAKKSYDKALDIMGKKPNKIVAGVLAGALLIGAAVTAGVKILSNSKAIENLEAAVDNLAEEV